MQLRVRAAEVPPDTRTAIERKLRFNLGRHSTAIDRAQVTLGPNRDGDPEHRCRIRVRLHQGQQLTVEGRAGDPLSAAGAAAWRLEHRLDRLRTARALSSPPRRRGPLGERSADGTNFRAFRQHKE